MKVRNAARQNDEINGDPRYERGGTVNGSFRMPCSNRQARNAMRCLTTVTLTLLVCLGTAATTAAQTAKDMIGTWRLVSDVNTASDGGKVEPFGHTPEGIAIFDSGGHFAIVISRPDLPKFASNNRMQGTPEENKAIVQGSIGFFGEYAVADGVLVQHVEGGTWPSWLGRYRPEAYYCLLCGR